MVNKNIPQITQNLIAKIKEDADTGTYRKKFGEVKIDVFPYVFPPDSPFSKSSSTVYNQFGDLSGKKVLDIGTGTGILAIQAVLANAEQVDAVDILPEAVECANHNFRLNNVSNKAHAYGANLFSIILYDKRYDLIIANLPIVDATEKDLRFHSLMDPGFKYHKRLFEESKNYLSEQGKIVLCHADLSSKNDFKKLESLAQEKGFSFKILEEVQSLGYTWRNYEFRR